MLGIGQFEEKKLADTFGTTIASSECDLLLVNHDSYSHEFFCLIPVGRVRLTLAGQITRSPDLYPTNRT